MALPDLYDSVEIERSGFWRRAVALLIDRPVAVAAPPPLPAYGDPVTSSEQAVAAAIGVEYMPPLPPPLPQARWRNYFARHWRGELSLPKSYWVNGFLGGIVVGIAVIALAHLITREGEAQPILWMVSLIVTWVVVSLFTMWQSVGVWRSATHYKAGGNKFWGGAAKTVTVLGVLNVAYNCLFVGTAQLAGIYEIVSGDTRVGPHKFALQPGGQMLEFSGGITFGVAQEFELLLDTARGVRTVRLNSIGGRILEAQKMSDVIKARGLSTYVMQDCLSACTIVFLGGKERFMLPTARLGFHQPAFRGMTAAARRSAIATEQARLQRFGLSRAFAERATTATPNGMWYPDKDELVREHVVTKIFQPPPRPNPPATPPPPAPQFPPT